MCTEQLRLPTKLYDNTQRLKAVTGDVYNPYELMALIDSMYDEAERRYNTPLVQLRSIVPLEVADTLVRTTYGTDTRIAGIIPFNDFDENRAIVYLQKESPGRPSYGNDDSLALARALDRAREPAAYGLNGLYNFETIMPGTTVNPRSLAEELVESHKSCFDYPHDANQQDVEGVMQILSSNPILLARTSEGNVASVAMMETDNSFAKHTAITLYEPTFWTVSEHRRQGLSVNLRHLMQELIDQMGMSLVYVESVRKTSYITSLRSGFNNGGYLGPAYTAIGPATPDTGYMPMGLSYYASSDIRIQ